ncbi:MULTISPECIES: hypothetical protein [Enterobacterales]|uniref:hypothetical protein n=1 Tax=Enterobacterales TaxID=91347 RepID=UPI002ED9F46F
MFEVSREFLDGDDYAKTIKVLATHRDSDDKRSEDHYFNESAYAIFMDLATKVEMGIGFDEEEEWNEIFLSILSGEGGDEKINKYISEACSEFCDNLTISKKMFNPLIKHIILLIISDNYDDAYSLFRIAMYPYTLADETMMAPVKIGKTGGRPEHHRKAEALQIARDRMTRTHGTPSEIANHVFGELSKRHTDNPSFSSIREWVLKIQKEHN